RVRPVCRGNHGLGIGDGVGQRLLAQDVLAGRQQGLDDLPVQGVRDDDADDVDVLGVDDVVPVGVMAGVAEALSGRGGEVCGDIADGDEFYRREFGGSCGGRRAPGGGV